MVLNAFECLWFGASYVCTGMQGEISVLVISQQVMVFRYFFFSFFVDRIFQVARNMQPKIFNLNLWCLAGINWKWLRFIKLND